MAFKVTNERTEPKYNVHIDLQSNETASLQSILKKTLSMSEVSGPVYADFSEGEIKFMEELWETMKEKCPKK